MNILLTSVGRRTYMVEYLKAALGGEGKVFATNSAMTYSMEQADGWLVTPLIYADDYIDCLLDYCKKEHIDALLSLFDIDLPVLARHAEQFAAIGTKVLVSSPRVTDICNDKWQTHLFLDQVGVGNPKTYIDLDKAVADLERGNLSFPLIVKPRWGMGSIGVYEVETMEELQVFWKMLKRRIFSTYLRYESKAAPENCVLIQEKVEGQEYGIDLLNDLQGQLATVVAKKKAAMRAGETDVAEIVDAAPFMPMARTLSTSLRHIADLDVDVLVTPTGEAKVIEMNCRFGGQYPFSHLAGVDFPKQIVKWLKGEGNDESLLHAKVGTVCCKDLAPVKWRG